MTFKLTLDWPLYTRKTSSNEERPLGYLPDGSVIEVMDVVIGKPIDGNAIWYKTTENVYYWSGGVDAVEFTFPGKDFRQLSPVEQEMLVSQAMDYYYGRLAAHIEGFTGMAVGIKKSGGVYKDYYALVIQVTEKRDDTAYSIPKSLPYYGFKVPTDIETASLASSNVLGDAIVRKNITASGAAGFVTTKLNDTTRVLVTNYHVACIDLLLLAPRKLSLLANDKIKNPEILMVPGNNSAPRVIGRVTEGHLDRFSDIALVQLEKDVPLTNSIEFIGDIKGIRTVESMKENFQPDTITVQMFGPVSKFCTGRIISLNAKQPIAYLGGSFVHLLKGLIQVTKMSQPGDSGSAVVDSSNKLVGILVASDSSFSYVLSIESILRNFTLNRV